MAGTVGDLYGPAPTASPTPTPGATPRPSAVGTSPSNAPSKATPASSVGDLYGDAKNVGGAVMEGTGQVLTRLGVPAIMDLLDRQRQATQAGIAGGPGAAANALVHGQSPQEQDTNRAAVRKKIGIESSYDDPRLFGNGPGTFGIPVPNWATQLGRGIDDFATDTVTDPVSALGPAEARGIGGLVKGIGGAVSKAATKVAPKLAQEFGEYGHAVTDHFTYGGAAKRKLGEPLYDKAIAAENRQAALEDHARSLLTKRFDTTVASLSDADRLEVYRALNGERDTRMLTPAQLAAYKEGRHLTTVAGGMQGDASARLKLAYGGGHLAPSGGVVKAAMRGGKPFIPPSVVPGKKSPLDLEAIADRLFGNMEHPTMSKNLFSPTSGAIGKNRKVTGRIGRKLDLGEMAHFASPPEQGIMNADSVRARYLPAPHAGLADADRPARDFNLLQPTAPNLNEREEFTVDQNSLPGIDQAFRSMLAKAAQQGTAGRMRDELGVSIAPGELNDDTLTKLFQRTSRATGAERSVGEKASDRWRQVVNIPKNTVSTLGLKHGLINVPALAFASEGPGAALEGLVGGVKALGRKPEGDFAANKAGILGGVITPFGDRENPIADTLARIPGPVGKVIGGASEKANRLTWAIDDAAKQAVFKRKYSRFRAQGLSHQEAADKASAQTLREMVDYRHSSDAVKALQQVAPFANFRAKIPGAIASSLSRNPQRLLALDRATTGLSSSSRVGVPGENDAGRPNQFIDSNPISDVMELGGDPNGYGLDKVPGFKYARSMIADPLKALLSVPGDVGEGVGALSPREAQLLRYFTYGQHLLPHMKDGQLKAGFLGQQAAGYVPLGLGEDALGVAGGSDFSVPDPLSMLLGGTVGGYVR